MGDHVTGVLFNSGPNPKAGTVISITPGQKQCNVQVQFTEAILYGSSDPVPRMALREPDASLKPRDVQGANHGTSGSAVQLYSCVDYCDTGKLTKIS